MHVVLYLTPTSSAAGCLWGSRRVLLWICRDYIKDRAARRAEEAPPEAIIAPCTTGLLWLRHSQKARKRALRTCQVAHFSTRALTTFSENLFSETRQIPATGYGGSNTIATSMILEMRPISSVVFASATCRSKPLIEEA